jgi:2-(3-amino-3-carboxypropyl)histidine synthase
MKKYDLKDLEEHYDLNLDKVVFEINNLKVTRKSKAKLVLLQFPDGLKQYATAVVDDLRLQTNAEFLIWIGSCFGACDTPIGLERLIPKIDLVIQFGHNELMPSY